MIRVLKGIIYGGLLSIILSSSVFAVLELQTLELVTIVADPIEDRISNITTSFFKQTDQMEAIVIDDLISGLLEEEPDQVRGRVLNYPNPFTMEEGTMVGYYLSNALNVTLKIFDMYGAEIFSEDYESGSNGGLAPLDGYNRIFLDRSSFGGQDLKTGVYIFVIMNGDEILSKGKMAVIQ
jgi:hypothetical protein